MARKRSQLNINIDPELLIKLKSEATKSGKTLTNFVIEKLTDFPSNQKDDNNLEERLLRVEKMLNLNVDITEEKKVVGSIFTDEGAKNYGKTAKELFESHLRKKGIDTHAGLREIEHHLKPYPHGNPELVFQILLGTHDLTGLEMTNSYRYGSCPMRSALNDWTNDPLEKLNKAFLDAVITKTLV